MSGGRWGRDARWGDSGLIGPDGQLSPVTVAIPHRYKSASWTKVCDFTDAYTASGSGTTSLTTDNAIDATQLRLWTPSAAAETLTQTGTIPAENQFTIGGNGTIGILYYTASDTAAGLRVSCGQGGFVNFKFFNCLSGAYRAGWKFLAFDAGMTSADGAGANPGATIWGTYGSGTFVDTVTKIRLEALGAAIPMYLHSIWRGGRDVSKVVIGFDNPPTTTNGIYDVAYPVMKDYGWTGYLAIATDTSYLPWDATKQSLTDTMVSDGWNVINNSHTHTSATSFTTAQEFIDEYTLSIAALQARGYGAYADKFVAWPGNSTTALAKSTLTGMGFLAGRSLPRKYHNRSPIGGFIDPLEIGSVDWSLYTATQCIAQIDAAIRMGATVNLFAQGITTSGDPGNGSITGDGLNIYASNFYTVMEALKSREIMGKCQVQNFSDWYTDIV